MKFWWRNQPPIWSYALWPASLAWRALGPRGAGVKVPVPVISVGNLVVGGAGKTPVSMFLATRLAVHRPAILTRGYRGGDEARLMKQRGFNVYLGANRVESAQRAVADGAGVVLLDDGLQHRALQRDLDVIVVDASNPLGNGAVLPMGPLRELPSSLRRVRRGLLWLTHCELPHHPRLAELPPFPRVESKYTARADLRGKRVFAFAGIARPEHFLATVLSLGAEVTGTRWFGDHHMFAPSEIRSLQRAAGDALLVTTEKDLVRIDDPQRIISIPVEVELVKGQEALDGALREIGL